MAQQLNRKVLLQTLNTGASTGDWVPLNFQVFSGIQTVQSILGTVAAGDTVFIEATNQEPYIAGVPQVITQIVTVSSFTTNFFTVLDAPVVAIRARKTGTAGISEVIGVLV